MFVLDTDFIFAFFDANQSTHYQSVEIVKKHGEEKAILSNLVKQELATVLSYKLDFDQTKTVFDSLYYFDIEDYFFLESEIVEIWKIFWSFKKNKISFVDCSNLYLARKNKLRIASFDRFYPENIKLF